MYLVFVNNLGLVYYLLYRKVLCCDLSVFYVV